jgi:hypothetical protein
MPNHTKQRIASLRELIKGGLDVENLDKIVAECNALAQDTSNVLSFFILKQVFAEMSAAFDGEAVTVTQHKDVVSGIAEPSIWLLRGFGEERPRLGGPVVIEAVRAVAVRFFQAGQQAREHRVIAASGDEGTEEPEFDFLPLVQLLGGGRVEAEQAGCVQLRRSPPVQAELVADLMR